MGSNDNLETRPIPMDEVESDNAQADPTPMEEMDDNKRNQEAPIYLDKHGNLIEEGMMLRFSDGSIEKVYLTDDGYGGHDLGINASNEEYMRIHDVPDEYHEYYCLSNFSTKDMEIVEGRVLTVLVVNPMQKPEVKQIENTLEDMQKMVGGKIQLVYPFEESVGIVCNEEGKLMGLPSNRFLRDETTGQPYDILCGTFLVTGLKNDEFCSLTDEQIRKYSDLYDKERIITLPKEKSKKQKER